MTVAAETDTPRERARKAYEALIREYGHLIHPKPTGDPPPELTPPDPDEDADCGALHEAAGHAFEASTAAHAGGAHDAGQIYYGWGMTWEAAALLCDSLAEGPPG